MKLGTLTLERVLGPDPEPEFRYCSRCDNDMSPNRQEGTECSDCEGAAKYHPRGVQGKYLPPHNPAYEVSLHYNKHPKHCPTIHFLEAKDITYMVYTAKRDEIEFNWAHGLLNPELPVSYPIVVITAYGKVIDHWDGFDLAQLSHIPAAREAAINSTRGFESRVPSRELVAA